MNKLQKILLSAVTILSFGIYSVYVRTQDSQVAAMATAAQSQTTQNATPAVAAPNPIQVAQADLQSYIASIGDDEEEHSPRPTTAIKQTSTQTKPASQPVAQQNPQPIAQAPRGKFKDGTYTGQSVNVFYGNVQVQAIIRNGALADVKFLSYPSDRGTSVRINSYAMPQLTQEAIQAQSAQVDGVSGASATSQGFVQSLGDALSQAQA